MARVFRPLLVALVGVAAGLAAPEAAARSGGMPGGGCSGCHNNGDQTVSASNSGGTISPGEEVTITVTISHGSGAVVGMFVEASTGSMDTIGGQGLAEVAAGLTHTSPKSMGGGSAQFSFRWTAPGEPGAVRFDLSTMVGNGNGNSSGDFASEDAADFVYGCEPQQFWRDHDGDGYGRDTDTLVHCEGSAPSGYAPAGGDCDDNRDTTHPDATEFCNQRDDDCNGEVDDDALPVALYPDEDGDGYYGRDEFRSGDMMMGCIPTPGYAGEPHDCQPTVAEINPGAEEVCNGLDDNCDGRHDEFVRPRCGEGWCRREAPTCEEDTCVPGEPMDAERCNFFDDDCDGLVDEDAECDDGEICVAGECRLDDSDGTTGGDPMPTDGSGDAGQDGGETKSKGCRVAPFAPTPTWLLAVLFALRRRRDS